MIAKLCFDWSMDFANLFIKNDLIKLLDHLASAKLSQAATGATRGTGRIQLRHFGKLDRRIVNLAPDLLEPLLGIGGEVDEDVRGGGALRQTLQS